MAAILTALGSGMSAKKILEFLIRKSPDLAPRITQALASGLSAEKVLKFFSKDKNFDKLKQSMEEQYPMQGNANPLVQAENIRGKNLAPDMASGLQRQLPKAIGTAAAMGGSYALSRAIPSILQQGTVANAVNQQPNSPNPMPNNTQKLSQIPETQPQQPPPQNVNNVSSVTQTAPVAQPQGIVNPKEYLDKLGIKGKVDDLLKRGNSPEQAAATLGMQGGAGKVSGKIDPELLANIDAYAKEAKTEQGPMVEQPSQELDKGQEAERQPIAKNETVSSPHGVGEVKEIRNGQAIIDVDGKLHKAKEEELETSPIPEKELASLYDELIQGIEHETGEDVSRMVQWAGYNPETNTLQFLPHTGKLYKYGNISIEDAALLTDILSTRKTSGENFIGAWKKDSKSPIGAALSKLIRKLQDERGGKGKEYEETHEPIYSAYEPAIQAAKKKKKKK